MTFSEQLIYLIDEFAKRIGVVIDWTNSNIMPYLQDLFSRYMQLQVVKCSIGFGLSIIGFIIACVLGMIAYKIEQNDPYSDAIMFCVVGAIACALSSLFGFMLYAPLLLEAIFVPEFYLYEQLMSSM